MFVFSVLFVLINLKIYIRSSCIKMCINIKNRLRNKEGSPWIEIKLYMDIINL